MKKAIITFLTALAYIHAMQAQTIDGDLSVSYDSYCSSVSIPHEFCYGNTPLLVLHNKDNNSPSVRLYDENLNLVKKIDLKNDFTFDYTLDYQDEKREVIAVNETYQGKSYYFSSYEQFVERENTLLHLQNSEVSSDFSIESAFIIEELENGDKIIKIDYSKIPSYGERDNNRLNYFAFEQYGFKYPLHYYYVEKNGAVYDCDAQYAASYSEWVPYGTHKESRTHNINVINLYNLNLNENGGNSEVLSFDVSQTLFNDDEKFEYLIPKFKLSKFGESESDIVSPSPGRVQLELTRSTLMSDKSNLALAGFQVVSEDGTIVKDIDFDNEFEGYATYGQVFVITIGKNTYLAFTGTKNGNDCTVFYKIDRTTSSIQQAKSVPAALMQIVPTVAKSGSEINVNFGDDNKDGSQIEVISASGAKVKSMNVPAGQKSAQFSVHGASGLYCVSRVQKNQPRETKKIIIK